jgi:hypothetical protein
LGWWLGMKGISVYWFRVTISVSILRQLSMEFLLLAMIIVPMYVGVNQRIECLWYNLASIDFSALFCSF